MPNRLALYFGLYDVSLSTSSYAAFSRYYFLELEISNELHSSINESQRVVRFYKNTFSPILRPVTPFIYVLVVLLNIVLLAVECVRVTTL
ncbi:hypothetical protein F4818DRAFT_402038 [Hypoxylon cercidicola]|nr:hypothetical protein F4818DRAFT_402038 [Hypoxylon cercidicola]